MEQFIKLFKITPKGNGYLHLCRDEKGKHYCCPKTSNEIKNILLFKTPELAQEYINIYLDSSEYEINYILYNKDNLFQRCRENERISTHIDQK